MSPLFECNCRLGERLIPNYFVRTLYVDTKLNVKREKD